MSKFAKLLGVKAPKPDPAVQQKQEKLAASAETEEKGLQKKQTAKLKALRGRSSGQRSLLSGLETGVIDEEKRKTLG